MLGSGRPFPCFLRAPAPTQVWLPGSAGQLHSAPVPGPPRQPAPGSSAFLRKPLLTAGDTATEYKRAPDTHTQTSPLPGAQGHRPAAAPGSGRQLIQALLPPAAQVLLDDFRKEVPLQQRVSQGQQLAHRLVEVLQQRRENKSRPRPQWLC